MSELLPCPFCGGNFIVACRTNDKSKYVVMCNETDCQMEVLTDQFDTRSEAVAAWNTRTPTTSAIEAAKTAAEEILDWLNFDCALDEVKEDIEAVTYIISKHLPDARAVDGEWMPIETAPLDGTRILVDFGRVGVHAVAWEQSIAGTTGWCVDDLKFGPYALRRYISSDIKGWMPLPTAAITATNKGVDQ